jgi:hypothetical protein
MLLILATFATRSKVLNGLSPDSGASEAGTESVYLTVTPASSSAQIFSIPL